MTHLCYDWSFQAFEQQCSNLKCAVYLNHCLCYGLTLFCLFLFRVVAGASAWFSQGLWMSLYTCTWITYVKVVCFSWVADIPDVGVWLGLFSAPPEGVHSAALLCKVSIKNSLNNIHETLEEKLSDLSDVCVCIVVIVHALKCLI